MATYKCNECGHIFEDGEEARWTENHGFTYGNGERFSGCPICKGDYGETTPCVVCGSKSFFDEELENGVCKDCFEEYTKDFDFCVKLGANEEESVPINGAIAAVFSAAEINKILIKHAKEIGVTSFEKFAEQDKYWFAEMIADEVKNK